MMQRRKNFRPSRIQQLSLQASLREAGYWRPVVHHIFEETVLSVTMQIEYRKPQRAFDNDGVAYWENVVQFARVTL